MNETLKLSKSKTLYVRQQRNGQGIFVGSKAVAKARRAKRKNRMQERKRPLGKVEAQLQIIQKQEWLEAGYGTHTHILDDRDISL